MEGTFIKGNLSFNQDDEKLEDEIIYKSITQFELHVPILKNSIIEKTVVDLDRMYLVFETCDGQFIEIDIPYDLANLPKFVEDYLYLYSIPEDEIEQIVNYFEELVTWPFYIGV